MANLRPHLRAVSYFRQDLPLVLLLLVIIFASAGLGLLVAWPMAILIDSVLTPAPNHHHDFIHRLFLSPLPQNKLGQVIGLAAIGLAPKFTQDVLAMFQAFVANQINYNGLLRVRRDLYRKLQALNLAYHRSNPQGDAIYRLSSDTFACQAILQTIMAAVVAAVTLVTMGAVLMSRSVPLTLLALSVAPTLAAANVVFARRLKQRSLECKEYDTRFTTAVQRERISIARALLTEAPFVVLDEPTRVLDPHHEQLITNGLRNLKSQRTVVIQPPPERRRRLRPDLRHGRRPHRRAGHPRRPARPPRPLFHDGLPPARPRPRPRQGRVAAPHGNIRPPLAGGLARRSAVEVIPSRTSRRCASEPSHGLDALHPRTPL